MANWLRRAGRFRSLFEKTLERHGLPKSIALRRHDRERLRHERALARRRGRRVAVHAGRGARVRARGRLLGGRALRSGAPGRRGGALPQGSLRALRFVAARVRGVQRRLRCHAQGDHAYNTNDFWELVRHESGLPWESSIYVPKIMAAAIIGTNAAAFGFGDSTSDPAYAYEEVEAPRGHGALDDRARRGRARRGHRGVEPRARARPDAARSRRRRACASRPARPRRSRRTFERARPGNTQMADDRDPALRRDARRRRAGARHERARAASPERRQGHERAARGRGHRRAQARRRQGQGARQGRGHRRGRGRRRQDDGAARGARATTTTR